MEERVKLIIEELENLKETQIREDKENKEEVEHNKKVIADLEQEGKRLHSMRDAFEEGEEEYQDLSEEIAQKEAQIKELQSRNGELNSEGIEIRNDKAYTKQLDKVEEKKEELRKELKEKQRAFISSRKKIAPRLEEIAKEQARLEMDMDAIKRGMAIEEKRVLEQNQASNVLDFQKRQFAKLEVKYQENEKEQKYLSEMDIYAELDKIAAMLEQIDRLTFTDIKNGKDINLSVFEEEKQEEPVVEEKIEVETPIEQVTPTQDDSKAEQDIEKRQLAAARVLETQYGILKGDFLYDAVMKQIEAGEQVGDIHEFAREQLRVMRTLNQREGIEGQFSESILQLEKEMDRLGIEYEKDEKEETKKREQEEIARKKEEEEQEKKRKEQEEAKKREQEEIARKKAEEEARKKKAEQLLREAEEEKRKQEEEEKRKQEEEKHRKREEIIASRRREMAESKEQLAQIKIGSTMEYRVKGMGNAISGPYNKFEAQVGKNEINFNMNYMQQALTKGREMLKEMLDTNNKEMSKEFEDRLDPVVVNTLMTMDREYATEGKYLGEYLEFIATRGRKPMSFTIQYDLEQLEGKGLNGILNKFDKQRQKVLANARKYAEMSKYYDGNMITIKEKKTMISKVAKMFKKKEEIKELPVVQEEIDACKGMDAYRMDNAVGQYNFKKAVQYKVPQEYKKGSPKMQSAEFNMQDEKEDFEEEL